MERGTCASGFSDTLGRLDYGSVVSSSDGSLDSWLMLRCETVADAMDRLQIERILGTQFDLLPDASNVYIHAALRHAAIVAPDTVKKLVARKNHSRVRREMVQQTKFKRTQFDVLP